MIKISNIKREKKTCFLKKIKMIMIIFPSLQ
jgi:hypothetical protein